jgi:hypothetical protein
MAATRTRRRGRVAGVDVHGEDVVQAKLGLRQRACVAGARARARVLVFQSRGVAVPCAGLRHPGPAARRGGGTVAGEDSGASGSCTKNGTEAEGKGRS